MALRESDLKRMIRVCVDDLGHEVTLAEFADWIFANHHFDDDDLLVSLSRPNEFVYEQRIRNLKSHNSYVSGVGLCEIGDGAYIRWVDARTYVLGNLYSSTCPSEVDVVLANVHEAAIVSAFDYLVSLLGGRRLKWITKARLVADDTFDIILPNSADEGRTCQFVKVLSTTHKVARIGALDVAFELSRDFMRLMTLSEGYDTVGVIVVMAPGADMLSFGSFELLCGDRLSSRVKDGVLRV